MRGKAVASLYGGGNCDSAAAVFLFPVVLLPSLFLLLLAPSADPAYLCEYMQVDLERRQARPGCWPAQEGD